MAVVFSSDKGADERKIVNQDYLKIDKAKDIFLFADGIGGYQHSELASETAVETAYNVISYKSLLRASEMEIFEAIGAAFSAAENDVCRLIIEEGKGDLTTIGGTTMDMIVVVKNMLYLGHVGNGRIYHHSSARGLTQLTVDDSINTRKGTKALTNCIGNVKKDHFSVSVGKTHLEYGNKLLCTTDGVHDYVPRRDIEEILGSTQLTSEQQLSLLKERALARSSKDDITIILYTHGR